MSQRISRSRKQPDGHAARMTRCACVTPDRLRRCGVVTWIAGQRALLATVLLAVAWPALSPAGPGAAASSAVVPVPTPAPSYC
jgi:hypothetical protein